MVLYCRLLYTMLNLSIFLSFWGFKFEHNLKICCLNFDVWIYSVRCFFVFLGKWKWIIYYSGSPRQKKDIVCEMCCTVWMYGTVWIYSCYIKLYSRRLTEVWIYHSAVTAREGYRLKAVNTSAECLFTFLTGTACCLKCHNGNLGQANSSRKGREESATASWLTSGHAAKVTPTWWASLYVTGGKKALMVAPCTPGTPIGSSLPPPVLPFKNTVHFSALAEYSRSLEVKKETILWVFRHIAAPCNYAFHGNF